MRVFGRMALPLAALLGACNAEGEKYDPPRQATLTPARPIPTGTAPVGTAEYLKTLAPPGPAASLTLVRQGQENYQVFCTPCHGASGEGDGAVTQRGFPRPPSFHGDQLLSIEPARIVAVIGEGKGAMLPMAELIPPAERWAIAYYVKALQLSRLPSQAGRTQGEGTP